MSINQNSKKFIDIPFYILLFMVIVFTLTVELSKSFNTNNDLSQQEVVDSNNIKPAQTIVTNSTSFDSSKFKCEFKGQYRQGRNWLNYCQYYVDAPFTNCNFIKNNCMYKLVLTRKY